MGYQKRAFTESEWLKVMMTAREVINSLPKDMIMGGNGTGYPITNKDEICFNGNEIDDQYHETFHITKAKYADFNFCKTASKPYDVAVVAVLCLVEHIAPGVLNIGSDGNSKDWAAGLALAQKIVPEVKLPSHIK
jgi:hypothetical protein